MMALLPRGVASVSMYIMTIIIFADEIIAAPAANPLSAGRPDTFTLNLLQMQAFTTKKSRHRSPQRSRTHKFRNKEVPADFAEKVASINETFDDVVDFAYSVNASVMSVADLVTSTASGFNASLTQLKELGNSLQSVVGQALVDWVNNFADDLKYYTGMLFEEANMVKLQTPTLLKDMMGDFGELKDSVISAYTDAGTRVDELASVCTAADSGDAINSSFNALVPAGSSVSNEDEDNFNPIEWMKKMFGGKESPCSRAQGIIGSANSTAEDVSKKIAELNTTLGSLIGDAKDKVLEGIASINSTYTGSMGLAADMMNDQIKSSIDNSISPIYDLINAVGEQLSDTVEDLHGSIDGAMVDLQPLFEATAELVALAEPCCSQSFLLRFSHA